MIDVETSSAPPFAAGQADRDDVPSSVYPYGVDDSFSYSITIILVVLVACFVIFGFSCFYVKRRFLHGSATAHVNRALAMQKGHAHGLDTNVVNSFPVFPYSTVKHLKIGKGTALQCAVCLSEFEDNGVLRLLTNCDHVFHQDCIDIWLASHTTCPVCRSDLTRKTAQYQTPESTREDSKQSPPQDVESTSLPDVQPPATELEVRRGEFLRWHSTGHSLIQPGENCERYTLRLPEEVKRRMVRLNRTKSCDVEIQCCGGEGSSGGRRSSQDRWMFRTPSQLAWEG